MWFFFFFKSFFNWFCPPEPEPRTETADKAEFIELIDNFVSKANYWNFHHKKAALLEDLADLFAPEDAEVRDAFIAEIKGIIGSKWNFLCNRHEIAAELEEAVCDLTDPGGPLDPDNNDDDCPTGDPETTVQVNLTAEDDFYEVPDNASGTIAGNDGNDEIIGAGYDDYLAGNGGDDTISGDCGDDTISGGRGDDVIEGGRGDDLIRGAFGSDTVSGGEGADTFALNARLVEVDHFDLVLDFSAAEGDQFDLGDIDAARVTVQQNGDNAELLVDGNLQFNILDTTAADVEASIVYDSLV